MSLIEAIQAGPQTSLKGPRCGVHLILTKLDDDEGNALRAILTDPDWKHTDIASVLNSRGFDVAENTISRHRRGKCKCAAA